LIFGRYGDHAKSIDDSHAVAAGLEDIDLDSSAITNGKITQGYSVSCRFTIEYLVA
jgi:hypothetical protein